MVDVLGEIPRDENTLRVAGQLVQNVGHAADEVILDPLRLRETQDVAAVQVGGADEKGFVASNVGEDNEAVVTLPKERDEAFILALENHTRFSGAAIEDPEGEAALVREEKRDPLPVGRETRLPDLRKTEKLLNRGRGC